MEGDVKDTAGRVWVRCPLRVSLALGLGPAELHSLTSAGSDSAHNTQPMNLSVTHPATRHMGLPRDLARDLCREKSLYAGCTGFHTQKTLAEIYYRNPF